MENFTDKNLYMTWLSGVDKLKRGFNILVQNPEEGILAQALACGPWEKLKRDWSHLIVESNETAKQANARRLLRRAQATTEAAKALDGELIEGQSMEKVANRRRPLESLNHKRYPGLAKWRQPGRWLTVVMGSLRGGPLAWQSLDRYVLDHFQVSEIRVPCPSYNQMISIGCFPIKR